MNVFQDVLCAVLPRILGKRRAKARRIEGMQAQMMPKIDLGLDLDLSSHLLPLVYHRDRLKWHETHWLRALL
jgi:hypothetical protein